MLARCCCKAVSGWAVDAVSEDEGDLGGGPGGSSSSKCRGDSAVTAEGELWGAGDT